MPERRHKNNYTNYSFERSIISFHSSSFKINKELFNKNYMKEMRTFHVSLFFLKQPLKAAQIHCAANNNTLIILAPFNSSGECTFEKKSRND